MKQKPDLSVKLRDVPHRPGVYLMRDRLNRVIYVGKARDLRRRLSHYFTPSRSRLADLKTRALIRSIWDFDFHEVRNEPEALLLEGRLIKDYRPRYNVSFRDDKRFLLLKIHLEDPWPRFQLVRVRKEDGARYFGPFAHSGALRTTLNWLNREFALRSCRPASPDEDDYRHCSADIIRNCSAPCVGKITREEYLARVLEACAVFEGRSKPAIEALEGEMHRASGRLEFEKAAELRDMVADLKKTLKPARKFVRGSAARAAAPARALEDVEELRDILGLAAAPLVMECFDISNISTTHCVASMVRFRNGVPDRAGYRRYRIRTVRGQDDFASMAEVVRRRYSRILLEARDAVGADQADLSQESPFEVMQRLGRELREDAEAGAIPQSKGGGRNRAPAFVRLPDLVVVDGGKGQLSSAARELRRLGLHDLPLIGLAKEREEIFRPGVEYPIVLPHETGALQLLQRIRDEAHRFANGYHQLLMKRRVEESILDDCAGISQARKRALLTRFGSVARLRRASIAEIAEVAGIGPTLADDIARFLETHRG